MRFLIMLAFLALLGLALSKPTNGGSKDEGPKKVFLLKNILKDEKSKKVSDVVQNLDKDDKPKTVSELRQAFDKDEGPKKVSELLKKFDKKAEAQGSGSQEKKFQIRSKSPVAAKIANFRKQEKDDEPKKVSDLLQKFDKDVAEGSKAVRPSVKKMGKRVTTGAETSVEDKAAKFGEVIKRRTKTGSTKSVSALIASFEEKEEQ